MSGYADVRRAACEILADDGPRGSGCFVLADGHLITCHHVIEGASNLRVRLAGETESRPATYVPDLSSDPRLDVAVLKIESPSPCVQLGPARSLAEVLAHGFRPGEKATEPNGHTFHGHLSPGQDLHTGERSGPVMNFDTNSGLVKGVSGGPVYDPELRRVVGVLRAIEGEARAYVTDLQAAVPELVALNLETVPDQQLDQLVALHGVQRVSERARAVVPVADRIFEPRFKKDYKIFGGRERELKRIDQFIEGPGRFFFVTGHAGFGKTALLVALVRRLRARGDARAYHFITPVQDQVDGETCLRGLCSQLLHLHGLTADLQTKPLSQLRLLYEDLLRVPPTGDRPIVVVLDGLDEALSHWEPGPDLFPADLADGVRVVFSARTMADRDWLEDLGIEDQPPEHVLELGRLDAADIRAGIEAMAGETAAVPTDAATLDAAVDVVARISEGDPFYVSDLLVELAKHGGDPTRLTDLPLTHHDYLVRWWVDGRARVSPADAFNDLMGTLAAARGPLRADDLPEVSAEDQLTRANIHELLERTGRYMTGTAHDGYRLSHARIYDLVEDRLAESMDGYRRALLTWCHGFRDRGWPADTPPYVLSHYGDHLTAALAGDADGAREDLYALADDGAYRDAERRAAPDEPLRQLRPALAALQTAIDVEDHVGIARYVLLHARLVSELSNEHAISAALVRGEMRVAAAVADQAEVGRRELLHLLIAWAMVDAGDLEGGRNLLDDLAADDDLPRFEGHEAACAGFLLAQLHAFPDQVVALAGRVLTDRDGPGNLVLGLIAGADPGLAQALAPDVRTLFDRVWAMHVPADLPSAADAGPRLALARRLLQRASGSDGGDLLAASYLLVHAHLRRDEIADALAVAREDRGDLQVSALVVIAEHQLEHDEAGMAATLDEAATLCRGTDEEIVVACARAKHPKLRERGLADLQSLEDRVRRMPDADHRGRLLARMVEALSELGELASARRIADGMADPPWREPAVVHIVRAWAAAGRIDDGRQAAEALAEPRARAVALAALSAAATGAGDGAARSLAFEAAQMLEPDREDVALPAAMAVGAALAATGLDEEGVRLALSLEDQDRQMILAEIARQQTERGDAEAAWRTLSAVSPRSFVSASRILWPLIRRGEVESAAELVHRFRSRPDVEWYSLEALSGSLTAAQAARGDADGARQRLIGSLFGRDGRVRTGHPLLPLAGALGSAGAYDAALRVTEGIDDEIERRYARLVVLRHRLVDRREGDAPDDLIRATLAELPDTARKVDVVVGMATAVAEADGARARSLLELATATLPRISDVDRWSGSGLIVAWSRLGDERMMLQVADDTLTTTHGWREWVTAASAAQRAGLTSAADVLYHRARAAIERGAAKSRESALTSLAQGLAAVGRSEEALALANEVGGRGVEIMIDIAHQQVQAGDVERARATIAEGRERARTRDRAFDRQFGLRRLADVAVEAGEAELALDLVSDSPSDAAEVRVALLLAEGRVREALGAIDAVDRGFAPDDLRQRLAVRAIKDDDLEPAWTVLGQLKQDYVANAVREKLTIHLAERGEFATALETAEPISDEGTRSRALWSVASAQAGAGDPLGAVRTIEMIRTGQPSYASRLVASLITGTSDDALSRLLSLAARSVPAAVEVCNALTSAYPEHASSIADTVISVIAASDVPEAGDDA